MLEARFSALLYALNLRFTYERATFYFESGESYTPDFFLRDKGLFIELKPTYPSIEEQFKCEKLAGEQGHAVVLMYGDTFVSPSQHSNPSGSRLQKNALRGMGWGCDGQRIAGDFMFIEETWRTSASDPTFTLAPVKVQMYASANTEALTAAYKHASELVFV